MICTRLPKFDIYIYTLILKYIYQFQMSFAQGIANELLHVLFIALVFHRHDILIIIGNRVSSSFLSDHVFAF